MSARSSKVRPGAIRSPTVEDEFEIGPVLGKVCSSTPTHTYMHAIMDLQFLSLCTGVLLHVISTHTQHTHER
jgi:hypothetical protein